MFMWNVVDDNTNRKVSVVVWRRRRASISARGRCIRNGVHNEWCAVGELVNGPTEAFCGSWTRPILSNEDGA